LYKQEEVNKTVLRYDSDSMYTYSLTLKQNALIE
jgi:hypothetical protein